MSDPKVIEASSADAMKMIAAEQAMTRFTWWLVGATVALFALFALVAATT